MLKKLKRNNSANFGKSTDTTTTASSTISVRISTNALNCRRGVYPRTKRWNSHLEESNMMISINSRVSLKTSFVAIPITSPWKKQRPIWYANCLATTTMEPPNCWGSSILSWTCTQIIWTPAAYLQSRMMVPARISVWSNVLTTSKRSMLNDC